MGGWLLLLAWVGLAWSQPMPMVYVGDLGHLEAGKTLRIGAAEARADGKGRVRVAGKGWFVDLAVAGGAGWSEVFQADFDGDGQTDFLVANHRPTFAATCGGATEVTVFLFDRLGRPAPWRLDSQFLDEPGRGFPFLPIRVLRPGFFVPTDCEGRVTGIYWAREGKLERRPGQARVAESARTLGEWAEPWPEWVVTERKERREIAMGAGYRPTVEAIRNGWPVRRMEGLWVDAAGGTRGDMVVEMVTGPGDAAAVGVSEDGACRVWTYERQTLRRCGGMWVRTDGGTREELGGDGVTVRWSHTAMGHTATSETKFVRPVGTESLVGLMESGEFVVTQWGPGRFALHSKDGQLLEDRVAWTGEGDLGFGGMVTLRGETWRRVAVDLRWRRLER